MIGLFSICSCANQGAPTGGPRDLTGPQVVETFPDTFAVLAAFDDEIRIVFDERISERGVQGTLDGAVIISPESGEVSVRHSGRALRVTMAGGFRPDEVYRVTVQPVVQDLFSNEMADAFEFIFSTGAEMTPTVLAGSIVDRITGERAEGARVAARLERPPGGEESDDQVVPTHVAITDSSGVYAFRYVPSGRYEITAFMDQNRNGGTRRSRADRDGARGVEPSRYSVPEFFAACSRHDTRHGRECRGRRLSNAWPLSSMISSTTPRSLPECRCPWDPIPWLRLE